MKAADQITTIAPDVTLTYSPKYKDHVLAVNGQEIAKAHCVHVVVDMWSLTSHGKLLGLIKGADNAVAQLTALGQRMVADDADGS